MRCANTVIVAPATAVQHITTWLLPQLRAFPRGDQASALKRARDTPLDVIEPVGIALSVVAVTALTHCRPS
jgi:hypothetical protein